MSSRYANRKRKNPKDMILYASQPFFLLKTAIYEIARNPKNLFEKIMKHDAAKQKTDV